MFNYCGVKTSRQWSIVDNKVPVYTKETEKITCFIQILRRKQQLPFLTQIKLSALVEFYGPRVVL